MNVLEDEVLELFKLLSKNNVRYILVGGLAVNHYGYSRTTGDVDLWLEDTKENRNNIVKTFKDLGIDGAEMFLTHPFIAGFAEVLLGHGIYIDLMAALQFIKQEKFLECYSITKDWKIDENTTVKVLHINNLIEEKEKSKRAKDNDDAIHLKEILTKSKQ